MDEHCQKENSSDITSLSDCCKIKSNSSSDGVPKINSNVNETCKESQNVELLSNVKRNKFLQASQKYRRIHSSPVKSGPSKMFFIQKYKRRKKKILSPKKLHFILPKISHYPTFAKHKRIKSKVLPHQMQTDVSNSTSSISVPEESLESNDDVHELFPKECDRDSELCLASDELQDCDGEPDSLQKSDEELDENEEDQDENDQQFEEHLSALLKASSTIACDKTIGSEGQRGHKQRRRHEDKIKALSFVPDLESQEQALVSNYLGDVKVALEKDDPSKYDDFISILFSLADGVLTLDKAYMKINKVLLGNPMLRDEFAMFLTPDQAIRLGKYSDYLTVLRMREFIEELKFYLSAQPPYMHKIIRTLHSLSQSSEHVSDSEELFRLLLPLFRRQPWLMHSLSFCIPSAHPYQCFSSYSTRIKSDEFEEINFNGLNHPDPHDEFEQIQLPDDDQKTALDCIQTCPCPCHSFCPSDDIDCAIVFANISHSNDCHSCGIKFIDGRVYVQYGRALRPVKISLRPFKSRNLRCDNNAPGTLIEETNGVEEPELDLKETRIPEEKLAKPFSPKISSRPILETDNDRPKRLQKKAKR